MLKHISATINTTVGSRVLQGVFFTALLAAFGLAACGSGGGSTTTTNTSTTTLPAPSDIVLSLVPARTSGVAPLAVFFDASATTDTGVTTRPFHDLEYTWSFGDPSSGTWASGAQPGVSSRNSATGPVAAHVFETPGTYTVTLTAFDGTNTATTDTTITVQDPDTVFTGTNTICVGATVLPTAGTGGCPAGASTVQQSNFATAINTYALTGKRVLFKRGDTFTGSESAWLKVTGPGIIGAFGTAAEISAGIKPKVQITIPAGTTWDMAYLLLSNNNTPGIEDWRVMDLEFDGLSQIKSIGVNTSGGFDQVTFLRMHMHDIKDGIIFNGEVLDFINKPVNKGHTMFDQITIVDSTITPIIDSVTGWRVYAFAQRLSIIGNTLGNIFNSNPMGSHVVRVPFIKKGVIFNNTIARSGSAMLAIKLHGPAWCDATSLPGECLVGTSSSMATPTYSYLTNTQPIGTDGALGGYTEHVIISDNEIIGSGSPYLVDIGPRDQYKDERVRDVIVERNFFKEGVTQTAVVFSGYQITARNNICNLTGGANQRYCFNAKRYSSVSPARPPDNIWVYNNTAYSGDASGGSQSFALVRVEFDVTNVVARNNLAYAPLAGAGLYHLIDDSNACGAACITASNNSTDDQVKNTFPGWVSATPAVPADFSLTAGSYAVNGGANVPVWSDFFRTTRPLNGVIDIGAVEGH